MQFNRAQTETHVSLLHQISNKNQEICEHTQQNCKQNCTGTSATQETGKHEKESARRIATHWSHWDRTLRGTGDFWTHLGRWVVFVRSPLSVTVNYIE